MSSREKKPTEQALLLDVPATQRPPPEGEQAPSSARFASPRPFRSWAPDQGQLLPERVREVLGEGHLACFFATLARVLDFSAFLQRYTSDRGGPAYHPVMMALLLMYAYACGIISSREIERRCVTDLAFRYLTGGQKPDHDTLCAFRVQHLESFKVLFLDTLRVARQLGFERLGHLAVDGTKMKANASKHKAMSYGRMEEAARKLDAQVQQLLDEAAALDAEEDERYGKGQRGDELPKELLDEASRLEQMRQARREVQAQKEAERKVELAVGKEKRLEKIREAQQAPEEEARQKAQEKGEDPAQAVPEEKAQRNFTDPDSRIMPKGGGFEQAYNAQVAVDADTQLIVAEQVLQRPNDMNQLSPTVEQVKANTGMLPKELSADSGYFSQQDIKQVESQGVECFVAPSRLKHGEPPPAAPRGRPPKGLSFKERMRRKLQTQRGRKAYTLRKVTAEPVIGQVKNGILPRFSLRGLRKVQGEFSLACAVHNLKKLAKWGRALPALALQGV